jgi:hypothetical protein
MSRVLTLLALALFAAATLTGCFDPEPSEISIIAKLNGERQGCNVQVFNASGKQIQQVSTDWGGIGYIKQLAPGTYTLKFVDNKGNPYPAEKEINLRPGESMPVEVELSEKPVGGAE